MYNRPTSLVSALLVQVQLRVRSVRLSVGNDRVFRKKNPEDWIEMPFGVVGLMGQRNDILSGSSELPCTKESFRVFGFHWLVIIGFLMHSQ